MDKAIRELLEKPFDKKYVSTRKGTGGRDLSYVEGAQYIQRLNDASEGQWSYSIIDHFTSERPPTQKGQPSFDLVVVVEVRAFGETRQAFGGAIGPKGECLGDDWKSALTDALKKAIASFGVALEYYCKGELNHEDLPDATTEPTPKAAVHTTERFESKSTGHAPKRATKRQLESIQAISRALGWAPEALTARCTKVHKSLLKDLTEASAAALIVELKGMSTQQAEAGELITAEQLAALKAIREQLGWSGKALVEAIGGVDPRALSRGVAQEKIEQLQKRALETTEA